VIAAAVVLAILIVAAVVVFSGLKGGEDKENVEKASEEKTEMPSEKQGMATAPSFKGDMQKFINSFYSCGVYILLQLFKYLAIGTIYEGGITYGKFERTD
jgi:hypothetical protein